MCTKSKISLPHQNDHQVQNIPDAAEVAKSVDVELQDLLHHIVEDEDAEDDLTANDKEVPVADIVNQLNCADLPGWDGTSCSWKLHHQSVGGAMSGGAWAGTVTPVPFSPYPQHRLHV